MLLIIVFDKYLWIFFNDANAQSKIQNLVKLKVSLLCQYGLEWVIKKNKVIAVRPVLASITPHSLKLKIILDYDFQDRT